MRLNFKPYLGLSIFTIISLFILIGLGNWQGDRLKWKTNLLEEVEQAANAAPFKSLNAIENALANDDPIDFRRIEIDGEIIGEQTPFLVYFRQKKELSWRPFLALQSKGQSVFFAGQAIPDADREAYLSESIERRAKSMTGYVRLARGPSRGEAKSTPSENRWFSFNPMPQTSNWADSIPGGADVRFYIDAVETKSDAESLPIKRPDIRNNHFDYMLTWYGLALCLFIIYLILHIRDGRLSFGTKRSLS